MVAKAGVVKAANASAKTGYMNVVDRKMKPPYSKCDPLAGPCLWSAVNYGIRFPNWYRKGMIILLWKLVGFSCSPIGRAGNPTVLEEGELRNQYGAPPKRWLAEESKHEQAAPDQSKRGRFRDIFRRAGGEIQEGTAWPAKGLLLKRCNWRGRGTDAAEEYLAAAAGGEVEFAAVGMECHQSGIDASIRTCAARIRR